ncbi:MAG: integrin alpha, partial [Planctomycetota bacterium]|nr:integrin alpha [Planctomycetota bacterium]
LGDGQPISGQPLDGSIRFFNISDLMADEAGTNPQYGASGSGEMFGFAMCYADISGDEGLLIGAPFADINNYGAAILYNAATHSSSTLANALPTTNANLGFAVAAGSDITGDGTADFIASAPNAGTGTVFAWEDSLLSGQALNGTYNGEKFGYSLAITDDANFNGSDDLVVGAPEAGNGKGRFAVHDMSSQFQYVLYTANGSNVLHSEDGLTGQLFGSAVSTAGDINQSTKSEILVGAIGANNGTGRVYIYSPPEQDIGPINLEVLGDYVWETNLLLDATNLSVGGGGELYWYIGTQAGSSISSEGYALDISGNVQLLAVTTSPGVADQYLYTIPDTIPDGQLLVFQVVEDRSGFVRSSTIDGGNVVDPGVTMFIDGNQAGAELLISTKWGIPNSPVYIYASLSTPSNNASNTAPDGDWDLHLRNAIAIGSPGDQSDLDGDFTSAPINVPASLSGVTAYFQAYDWDFFAPALTPVLVVTFQ